MQANTYLHLDGNCEDAFKFYEAKLGAKVLVLSRYGSAPSPSPMPANQSEKVIHGRIQIGDAVIMASDAPPGRYSKPQGFTLSLRADTPEEADRIFAALSEGGDATTPMSETFFAHRFGMVTDRFDVPWMVLCEKVM
jgi:PhnB protein